MYLCTVNHLLDNHTIDARMRYESHRLIYTIPNDEPTELGGILAAAILAVLLVDTPEGDARAIALQSEDEQADFFRRYNREVLRDDWGYLAAEVNQLRENYIQIAVGSIKLNDICPNRRQLGLALDLMTTYMRQLVVSTYGEHIWDVFPYQAPFPQWLINAARIETRRQRFLHTDWTDMPAVTRLAEMPDETEPPTFCFEGEKAEDIMAGYLRWLSDEYVAMKQDMPGARITTTDRKYIFGQETDWVFLSDEINALDTSEQQEWQQWMTEWTAFLTANLLPQKEIRFWADDIPEEVQEHLLYHLRLAEQHPAHFREVTTAVYAMRQLGYIRRKCSERDIRQWLSEHLKINYMERNNASQFQRAMKEHGRYTPEVRIEVSLLESMGYFRFEAPGE